MKLSCTNSMVPAGSLTDKAKLLKTWGYDGISVFFDYGIWDEALHKEILQLKSNTGIEVCEFAFEGARYGHGRLMDENPEIRRKARNMYKEAAKVCAELGAVTEVEFEYKAQDPIPMLFPYQKMPPDAEKDFLEMYREVAQVVQGTEAYVLIEPVNRYESLYLNCQADAMEIVKKLGMPNTGVLSDFFHMSIEERSIVESLREVGSYIKHIHLGDNNRLLPGLGNIDWETCIQTLKRIGYDRYLNLECSVGITPEKALPETALYIKRLLS